MLTQPWTMQPINGNNSIQRKSCSYKVERFGGGGGGWGGGGVSEKAMDECGTSRGHLGLPLPPPSRFHDNIPPHHMSTEKMTVVTLRSPALCMESDVRSVGGE